MLEPRLAGLVVVTAVLARNACGGPAMASGKRSPQAHGWSLIDGVAAVPIMAIIMLMALRKSPTGEFALTKRLAALGWLATVMAAPTVGMFATQGSWVDQ
jgi:hypothetical protein